MLLLVSAFIAFPQMVGRPLAISHVNLIDATGKLPQADMTVIISGSRIQTMVKPARSKSRRVPT